MISLSVIALVELFVVWALVNRLLTQASIQPIKPFAAMAHSLTVNPTNGAAAVPQSAKRKAFSLPIQS